MTANLTSGATLLSRPALQNRTAVQIRAQFWVYNEERRHWSPATFNFGMKLVEFTWTAVGRR